MRSLRSRLALACAAAVAIVVLVAGTLLVHTATRDQYRELDDSLERRAGAVAIPAARIARTGESAVLAIAGSVIDDLVVRVMEGERVRFDTGGDAAGPWPAVPDGFATVTANNRSWRTLRRPVDTGAATDNGFDVVVALPLAPTRETVTKLRRDVLLIGVVALAFAVGAGWLLGTWLLRPLARMRAASEQVAATTDLSRRVDVGRAPPDVAGVVDSMNTMLAHLESAAERERHALETSRSFSANVTHELRSPLTSLSTDLDVLNRHPELPESDRDALVADAQRAADRAAELLAGLEVLARGEVRDALDEHIDLSEIVDAAVAAARARYPEAQITVAQSDSALDTTGWPEGLRLLVDNLLNNAASHGRDAGQPARIHVTLEREDASLVLRIDDAGTGIQAAERDRMREPFVRGAAPNAPGTGLGLALVDQQVRLHGGTFALTTSPHGGTRAQIILPARDV